MTTPALMDEGPAREGRGMKWNKDEGHRSPGVGGAEMERLSVEEGWGSERRPPTPPTPLRSADVCSPRLHICICSD